MIENSAQSSCTEAHFSILLQPLVLGEHLHAVINAEKLHTGKNISTIINTISNNNAN